MILTLLLVAGAAADNCDCSTASYAKNASDNYMIANLKRTMCLFSSTDCDHQHANILEKWETGLSVEDDTGHWKRDTNQMGTMVMCAGEEGAVYNAFSKYFLATDVLLTAAEQALKNTLKEQFEAGELSDGTVKWPVITDPYSVHYFMFEKPFNLENTTRYTSNTYLWGKQQYKYSYTPAIMRKYLTRHPQFPAYYIAERPSICWDLIITLWKERSNANVQLEPPQPPPEPETPLTFNTVTDKDDNGNTLVVSGNSGIWMGKETPTRKDNMPSSQCVTLFEDTFDAFNQKRCLADCMFRMRMPTDARFCVISHEYCNICNTQPSETGVKYVQIWPPDKAACVPAIKVPDTSTSAVKELVRHNLIKDELRRHTLYVHFYRDKYACCTHSTGELDTTQPATLLSNIAAETLHYRINRVNTVSHADLAIDTSNADTIDIYGNTSATQCALKCASGDTSCYAWQQRTSTATCEIVSALKHTTARSPHTRYTPPPKEISHALKCLDCSPGTNPTCNRLNTFKQPPENCNNIGSCTCKRTSHSQPNDELKLGKQIKLSGIDLPRARSRTITGTDNAANCRVPLFTVRQKTLRDCSSICDNSQCRTACYWHAMGEYYAGPGSYINETEIKNILTSGECTKDDCSTDNLSLQNDPALTCNCGDESGTTGSGQCTPERDENGRERIRIDISRSTSIWNRPDLPTHGHESPNITHIQNPAVTTSTEKVKSNVMILRYNAKNKELDRSAFTDEPATADTKRNHWDNFKDKLGNKRSEITESAIKVAQAALAQLENPPYEFDPVPLFDDAVERRYRCDMRQLLVMTPQTGISSTSTELLKFFTKEIHTCRAIRDTIPDAIKIGLLCKAPNTCSETDKLYAAQHENIANYCGSSPVRQPFAHTCSKSKARLTRVTGSLQAAMDAVFGESDTCATNFIVIDKRTALCLDLRGWRPDSALSSDPSGLDATPWKLYLAHTSRYNHAAMLAPFQVIAKQVVNAKDDEANLQTEYSSPHSHEGDPMGDYEHSTFTCSGQCKSNGRSFTSSGGAVFSYWPNSEGKDVLKFSVHDPLTTIEDCGQINTGQTRIVPDTEWTHTFVTGNWCYQFTPTSFLKEDLDTVHKDMLSYWENTRDYYRIQCPITSDEQCDESDDNCKCNAATDTEQRYLPQFKKERGVHAGLGYSATDSGEKGDIVLFDDIFEDLPADLTTGYTVDELFDGNVVEGIKYTFYDRNIVDACASLQCSVHGMCQQDIKSETAHCVCADAKFTGATCGECTDGFAQYTNDPLTACKVCKGNRLKNSGGICNVCTPGKDPSTDCTTCLKGFSGSDCDTDECTLEPKITQPGLGQQLSYTRDVMHIVTNGTTQVHTDMRGVPAGVIPFRLKYSFVRVLGNKLLLLSETERFFVTDHTSDSNDLLELTGDWVWTVQPAGNITMDTAVKMQMDNTYGAECPSEAAATPANPLEFAKKNPMKYYCREEMCSTTSSSEHDPSCVSGGISMYSPSGSFGKSGASVHVNQDTQLQPIDERIRYTCVKIALVGDPCTAYYVGRWHKYKLHSCDYPESVCVEVEPLKVAYILNGAGTGTSPRTTGIDLVQWSSIPVAMGVTEQACKDTATNGTAWRYSLTSGACTLEDNTQTVGNTCTDCIWGGMRTTGNRAEKWSPRAFIFDRQIQNYQAEEKRIEWTMPYANVEVCPDKPFSIDYDGDCTETCSVNKCRETCANDNQCKAFTVVTNTYGGEYVECTTCENTFMTAPTSADMEKIVNSYTKIIVTTELSNKACLKQCKALAAVYWTRDSNSVCRCYSEDTVDYTDKVKQGQVQGCTGDIDVASPVGSGFFGMEYQAKDSEKACDRDRLCVPNPDNTRCYQMTSQALRQGRVDSEEPYGTGINARNAVVHSIISDYPVSVGINRPDEAKCGSIDVNQFGLAMAPTYRPAHGAALPLHFDTYISDAVYTHDRVDVTYQTEAVGLSHSRYVTPGDAPQKYTYEIITKDRRADVQFELEESLRDTECSQVFSLLDKYNLRLNEANNTNICVFDETTKTCARSSTLVHKWVQDSYNAYRDAAEACRASYDDYTEHTASIVVHSVPRSTHTYYPSTASFSTTPPVVRADRDRIYVAGTQEQQNFTSGKHHWCYFKGYIGRTFGADIVTRRISQQLVNASSTQCIDLCAETFMCRYAEIDMRADKRATQYQLCSLYNIVDNDAMSMSLDCVSPVPGTARDNRTTYVKRDCCKVERTVF